MLSNKGEFLQFMGKIGLAISVWRIVIFFGKPHTVPAVTTTTSTLHKDNSKTTWHPSYGRETTTDTLKKSTEIIIDPFFQKEKIKIQNILQDTIQSLDHKIVDRSLRHSISKISILSGASVSTRGYSSHDSIVLYYQDMANDEEFRQVLIHEIAHIIDFNILLGTSKVLDHTFTEFGEDSLSIDDPSLNYYMISRENERRKKEDQGKKDFCSLYGMSNPFEDFAECFNLYVSHHDYFLSLASQNTNLEKKYNYIAKLLGNHYRIRSQIKTYDTTKRYRDSTKLP